jgi:hypothetical protein
MLLVRCEIDRIVAQGGEKVSTQRQSNPMRSDITINL